MFRDDKRPDIVLLNKNRKFRFFESNENTQRQSLGHIAYGNERQLIVLQFRELISGQYEGRLEST